MQEDALRSAAPHGGGLRLGEELLSLVAERGDGEIGGGHKRIINELTLTPAPLPAGEGISQRDFRHGGKITNAS